MVQFLFLRQYSGTETFPRRLLYVWQRWKWIENLKTLTQLFRVLLLCLQKSATNYYGQCSLMKFVWYRFHNSTEFYVWVKALINDMSIAQNWPKTAISSWHSSIYPQDLLLLINCWWRLFCDTFVKTEVHCQLWQRGWPTSLLEEQVSRNSYVWSHTHHERRVQKFYHKVSWTKSFYKDI